MFTQGEKSKDSPICSILPKRNLSSRVMRVMVRGHDYCRELTSLMEPSSVASTVKSCDTVLPYHERQHTNRVSNPIEGQKLNVRNNTRSVEIKKRCRKVLSYCNGFALENMN